MIDDHKRFVLDIFTYLVNDKAFSYGLQARRPFYTWWQPSLRRWSSHYRPCPPFLQHTTERICVYTKNHVIIIDFNSLKNCADSADKFCARKINFMRGNNIFIFFFVNRKKIHMVFKILFMYIYFFLVVL